MADRVNSFGFQKDATSSWEGFPRTMPEAMSAGLPVIASDVGSAAEAIIEGITGYCIPRCNVEVLRDRFSRLIKDAELRRNMGYQGRQRYEAEFTFAYMFEKTFAVYKEVLGS